MGVIAGALYDFKNRPECLKTTASMSEWSKEPDLRPGSVSCVGSNPTRCNFFCPIGATG